MIWALFNDVMQRIITFNKRHQRKGLARLLETVKFPADSRVLDFGCGTALFAPVFMRSGLEYHGYDIDPRLVRYASRLYPSGAFLSCPDDLANRGPFPLIVANCCFHHIEDDQVAVEVKRMHDLLTDDGTVFLIDIVLSEGRTGWLKRLVFKLDQGAALRTRTAYRRLLESHFVVEGQDMIAQPFGPWAQHPLFLDLAVFRCAKPVRRSVGRS